MNINGTDISQLDPISQNKAKYDYLMGKLNKLRDYYKSEDSEYFTPEDIALLQNKEKRYIDAINALGKTMRQQSNIINRVANEQQKLESDYQAKDYEEKEKMNPVEYGLSAMHSAGLKVGGGTAKAVSDLGLGLTGFLARTVSGDEGNLGSIGRDLMQKNRDFKSAVDEGIKWGTGFDSNDIEGIPGSIIRAGEGLAEMEMPMAAVSGVSGLTRLSPFAKAGLEGAMLGIQNIPSYSDYIEQTSGKFKPLASALTGIGSGELMSYAFYFGRTHGMSERAAMNFAKEVASSGVGRTLGEGAKQGLKTALYNAGMNGFLGTGLKEYVALPDNATEEERSRAWSNVAEALGHEFIMGLGFGFHGGVKETLQAKQQYRNMVNAGKEMMIPQAERKPVEQKNWLQKSWENTKNTFKDFFTGTARDDNAFDRAVSKYFLDLEGNKKLVDKEVLNKLIEGPEANIDEFIQSIKNDVPKEFRSNPAVFDEALNAYKDSLTFTRNIAVIQRYAKEKGMDEEKLLNRYGKKEIDVDSTGKVIDKKKIADKMRAKMELLKQRKIELEKQKAEIDKKIQDKDTPLPEKQELAQQAEEVKTQSDEINFSQPYTRAEIIESVRDLVARRFGNNPQLLDTAMSRLSEFLLNQNGNQPIGVDDAIGLLIQIESELNRLNPKVEHNGYNSDIEDIISPKLIGNDIIYGNDERGALPESRQLGWDGAEPPILPDTTGYGIMPSSVMAEPPVLPTDGIRGVSSKSQTQANNLPIRESVNKVNGYRGNRIEPNKPTIDTERGQMNLKANMPRENMNISQPRESLPINDKISGKSTSESPSSFKESTSSLNIPQAVKSAKPVEQPSETGNIKPIRQMKIDSTNKIGNKAVRDSESFDTRADMPQSVMTDRSESPAIKNERGKMGLDVEMKQKKAVASKENPLENETVSELFDLLDNSKVNYKTKTKIKRELKRRNKIAVEKDLNEIKTVEEADRLLRDFLKTRDMFGGQQSRASDLHKRLLELERLNKESKPETKPSAEKPTEIKAKADFSKKVVTGNKTRMTTKANGGMEVDGQFGVVDVNDLQTSTDIGETQNRNRKTIASQAQVNSIANNPNPEYLIVDNPDSANGAMVITSDGTVLSGNGRTLGLSEAYKVGTATKYKDYLKAHAKEFGIDPKEIDKIENPVLVRIVDPKKGFDVKRFVKESNESQQLARNAAEIARTDAENIKGILRDFNSVEDIASSSNKEFIQKFFDKTVGNTERAMYLAEDGSLTPDGRRRVENALIASLYGDNPRLIEKLTNTTNEGIKNIANALISTARDGAKLKGEIDKGSFFDIDFTKEIGDAALAYADTIAEMKRQGVKPLDSKGNGTSPLNFYLKNMKDRLTPESKLIFGMLSEMHKSPKQTREFLQIINDVIRAHGDPQQGDLFTGKNQKPSKSQVIKEVLQEFDSRYKTDFSKRDLSEWNKSDRTLFGSRARNKVTNPVSDKDLNNFLKGQAKQITKDTGLNFKVVNSVDELRKMFPNNDIADTVEGGIHKDTVYLVKGNIDKDRLPLVIAHEVAGHRGVESLFENKQQMDNFFKSLERASAKDKFIRDAFAEVDRLGYKENRSREAMAKIVEKVRNESGTLKGTAKTFVNFITSRVRRFLRKLGFKNLQLNEAEVYDLAVQALRRTGLKNSNTFFDLGKFKSKDNEFLASIGRKSPIENVAGKASDEMNTYPRKRNTKIAKKVLDKNFDYYEKLKKGTFKNKKLTDYKASALKASYLTGYDTKEKETMARFRAIGDFNKTREAVREYIDKTIPSDKRAKLLDSLMKQKTTEGIMDIAGKASIEKERAIRNSELEILKQNLKDLKANKISTEHSMLKLDALSEALTQEELDGLLNTNDFSTGAVRKMYKLLRTAKESLKLIESDEAGNLKVPDKIKALASELDSTFRDSLLGDDSSPSMKVSVETLAKLNHVLKDIKDQSRIAKVNLAKDATNEAYEAKEKIVSEMKPVNEAVANSRETNRAGLYKTHFKPISAMNTLDLDNFTSEMGETMNKVAYKDMLAGQKRKVHHLAKGYRIVDDIIESFGKDKEDGIDNLNKTFTTVETADKHKYDITRDEAMAIYAMSTDRETQRIIKANKGLTLYLGNKKGSDSFTLSLEKLNEISKNLTPKEKEAVTRVKKSLAQDYLPELNAVHERLNGVPLRLLVDETYFPRTYMEDSTTSKGNGVLDGLSAPYVTDSANADYASLLKHRGEGAQFRLRGLTKTYENYVDQASNYIGMAEPLKKFNRILDKGMEKEITQRYGAEYVDRLKRMTELNAGMAGKTREDKQVLSRYLSNIAAAKLTPVSALKQFSSVPLASSVIPFKYLAKAMVSGLSKENIAEMMKLDDMVLRYRDNALGGIMPLNATNMEAERNLGTFRDKNPFTKAVKWGLNLSLEADKRALGIIYKATKLMAEAQGKGNDSAYIENKFMEAVRRTQNTTDLASATGWQELSRKSSHWAFLNMYLNQTQKLPNEYIRLKRMITQAEKAYGKDSAQYKEAKGNMVNFMIGIGLMNAMSIGLGMGAGALLNKDDEKTGKETAAEIMTESLFNFTGNPIIKPALGGSGYVLQKALPKSLGGKRQRTTTEAFGNDFSGLLPDATYTTSKIFEELDSNDPAMEKLRKVTKEALGSKSVESALAIGRVPTWYGRYIYKLFNKFGGSSKKSSSKTSKAFVQRSTRKKR